jgi:hypothetical protein
MEFGCVEDKDRLSVLVNNYLNEYFLDREFNSIVKIDSSKYTILYSYYDIDLDECVLSEIDFSVLDVV